MSAENAATRRARVSNAVRDNAPVLLAYFLRRVEYREDAADLLGDTLAVVWRRADRMPETADEARMWMYGVAAGVLRNGRRSARRRIALADSLRSELSVTRTHADDHSVQLRTDLERAMAALRPSDRELLKLVHWDGLTVAQAATVLNLKPSTARTRAERARAVLAARLGSDYAGSPAMSPVTASVGAAEPAS